MLLYARQDFASLITRLSSINSCTYSEYKPDSEEAEDEVENIIYEQLDTPYGSVLAHYTKHVIGDFNAKVGTHLCRFFMQT